jgi:hypothetical protein
MIGPMLKRTAAGLLNFKPGAGTCVGGGFLLFLCLSLTDNTSRRAVWT